ncbi:MAG TPA: hypothetical protein VJU85_02515 [Nitrososphaeraceae archaeon]|nr:hypothetical protein [Nitrososphaeraceae archaeon]
MIQLGDWKLYLDLESDQMIEKILPTHNAPIDDFIFYKNLNKYDPTSTS